MSVPVYATRGPIPFLFHYVRRRLGSHVVVLAAILAAVGCAVGAQYAVKNLVDVLGWPSPPATGFRSDRQRASLDGPCRGAPK